MITALQTGKLVATSKFASLYCLVSTENVKTGFDNVWLAMRIKGKPLRRILKLPVERHDRNDADRLYLNGVRAIALVNTAVDFFEPFFLYREYGKWSLLDNPGSLEGCIGGSRLVKFGEYQVYAVNCNLAVNEPAHSRLLVFGPAGLKVAKVDFQIGDIRKSELHSIDLEVWEERGKSSVVQRWVRFKWPFAAKDGYWQMSKVDSSK